MKFLDKLKIEWIGSCFLLFCLFGCQHSEADIGDVAPTLIIRNVNVIDAKNGLRPDVDVALNENTIVRVGKNLSADGSILTLDGAGKYLIPGLWDAHVHLTFDPEVESSMFRLLVANGITSVRDTGGKLEKVLAFKERAKTTIAPAVYIAGPLIDGHPAVYNGEVPGYPDIAQSAQTVQEVDQLVDDLAAAGVDLLKAYEMLSEEAFRALIARAKRYDLPVTGHVPLSMTAKEVSDAGLTSMEHMRNLEMACSDDRDQLYIERQTLLQNPQNLPGSKLRSAIHSAQHAAGFGSYNPKRCAEVIDTYVKNATWQIPTLTLMVASRDPYYADSEWHKTFEYLPEDVRSKWLKTANQYKSSLNTPSKARQNRALMADWKKQIVNQMNQAGVRFMAGTDTPIFFLTPGFSLHKELQTLVDAGLSPMEALASATTSPAEYFGLEKVQGQVEPGMRADLILLNANPLEDIRHTQEINSVILNGKLLDRRKLDQLLIP